MKKTSLSIIICALILIPFFGINVSQAQATENTFAKNLSGRFLLDVENDGSIWYVDTTEFKKHSVTWDNALELFENLSLGITNDELLKIPASRDGIAPTLDSDKDGYPDILELENNYSPYNSNPVKFATESSMSNRLKGKLLLQVEQGGRIWYVDLEGIRHHVTFENLLPLFESLSLGISQVDLGKIDNDVDDGLVLGGYKNLVLTEEEVQSEFDFLELESSSSLTAEELKYTNILNDEQGYDSVGGYGNEFKMVVDDNNINSHMTGDQLFTFSSSVVAGASIDEADKNFDIFRRGLAAIQPSISDGEEVYSSKELYSMAAVFLGMFGYGGEQQELDFGDESYVVAQESDEGTAVHVFFRIKNIIGSVSLVGNKELFDAKRVVKLAELQAEKISGVDTKNSNYNVIEVVEEPEEVIKDEIVTEVEEVAKIYEGCDMSQCIKAKNLYETTEFEADEYIDYMMDYIRCYNNKTVECSNILICDDAWSVSSCKENYAFEKDDPALCDVISSDSGKANCYLRFAIREEDISFCEIITDEYSYNMCHVTYACYVNEPSICENLDGTDKQECYMYYMDSFDNTDYCDYLSREVDSLGVCY